MGTKHEIKTILLDMDGVLVDVVRPVLRLNLHDESVIRNWPKGEYSIGKVLGMRDRDVWERVAQQPPAFWETLEVYPWAMELFNELQHRAPVVLCTSPGGMAHSAAGKLNWIIRQFGSRFANYVLTARKDLLANPNTVLIDDSEDNINNFELAGGLTILFPQPWNRAEEPKDHSKYVIQRIDRLLSGE